MFNTPFVPAGRRKRTSSLADAIRTVWHSPTQYNGLRVEAGRAVRDAGVLGLRVDFPTSHWTEISCQRWATFPRYLSLYRLCHEFCRRPGLVKVFTVLLGPLLAEPR